MNKLKKILLNAVLFIVAAIMIFPMLWMLIYSFKVYPESYRSIGELLSAPFTFGNYIDALKSDAFVKYFINSVIVGGIVTLGNVIFCLLVAYALVRKDFIGKKFLYFTVAAVMIIPQHVIMIPLYRLMVSFDWINTYWALTLPWLITPFGIYLVRQYIVSLPQDMEEAAKIDGAGQWYIIFKIVMPLCKPVMTVLAIYTFLGNWNSFLFPFLLTNTEGMRTLPVGLTFYLGKQSIDWGHLMAAAGISAIPIILVFIFFSRQIIASLTAGALKE